jgi:hypothetical protein
MLRLAGLAAVSVAAVATLWAGTGRTSSGVTLVLSLKGTGRVVLSSGQRLSCGVHIGQACSHRYEIAKGRKITLRAVGALGWKFARWSGRCVGTAATCHLIVREASTVVATFAAPVDTGTIPRFSQPTTPLQQDVPAAADEIASGDFNGDGLTDVIITRLGEEGTTYPVTILINKGDGRFVDATKTVFNGPPPLTQHPRQIVVADFNSDGRADAFIADHGADVPPFPGHQSTLILSQPGGKLFDATANLPQEMAFTHTASAADVDGNGTIDLYFGPLDKQPQILLDDGTGRFRVADGALPDLRGQPYSGSAFVDVNGDGSPDLVLARADVGGSDVVLLNSGRGQFSFAPSPLHANANGRNSVGLGIATGDINGDGRPDLVMASTLQIPFYLGANLQVLISNGDGTFRDETKARLPNEPGANVRWIAFPQLIDLNGDGKLDLVTHLDGYPTPPSPAYLNDGDGNFKPLDVAAYTRGTWTFVNDQPDQTAGDILALSDQGQQESYIFYRRIN